MPPERSTMPAWSPDGELIAYICYKDGPIISDPSMDSASYHIDAAEICIMNADGVDKRRLTHNRVADQDPEWSPDGSTIAFVSSDGLYVINPQGDKPQRLFQGRFVYEPSWSLDGLRIAFVACRPQNQYNSGSDIYIVNKDGQQLFSLDNPAGATLWNPQWSPDGRRLAYSYRAERTCSSGLFNDVYSLMIVEVGDTSVPLKIGDNLMNLGQIEWINQKMLAYSVLSEKGWMLYSIDLENGQLTRITPGAVTDQIRFYAWAPDGTSLAYTAATGSIYMQDRSSGQITLAWRQSDLIEDIVWSPNSQQLLITLSEKIPGRLNATFTETILVIGRDGQLARRLTPLMPGDSDQ